MEIQLICNMHVNVVRRLEVCFDHQVGVFCGFVARFYLIGKSDCMMQNNILVDLIGGVMGHETDVSRMNQSLTLSSSLKTTHPPLRSINTNLHLLVKYNISISPESGWNQHHCVRKTNGEQTALHHATNGSGTKRSANTNTKHGPTLSSPNKPDTHTAVEEALAT